MPGCNICSTQLKVTGESIVREHRAEMLRRAEKNEKRLKREEYRTRDGQLIWRSSDGHWISGGYQPRKDIEPPEYTVIQEGWDYPRFLLHLSSFFRHFFRAVNWNVAFEWTCWGVTILCLIYIGIFVMVPFGIKVF